MDKKEELKNNIMLKMQYHIDSQTLDLLGVILSIFVDKNFILKLNTRYMKSIIPFVTKER